MSVQLAFAPVAHDASDARATPINNNKHAPPHQKEFLTSWADVSPPNFGHPILYTGFSVHAARLAPRRRATRAAASSEKAHTTYLAAR